MQHDINSLLYTTDLSPNSLMAFSQAASLAKLTGAEIHILHVLEQLSEDAEFAIMTYIQNEKSREIMLNDRVVRAEKRLQERQDKFWAAQTAEDQKYRAQIKSMTVVVAYPAEAILKAAKQHNCDLIVMGTHERGMSHTFLGSVSKSVLRRSHVPTLIVPLVEHA